MREFHKRYDFLVKKLKRMTDLKDLQVVDCGCGDGDGSIHFYKAGCKVTGIDTDPKRIKLARKTFRDLDFEVGSITDLDIPDGFADIFICSETLEHLTREQSMQASEEIKRVCGDDAYICITVPENKKTCMKDKKHKQYLSLDDLISMFSNMEIVHSGIFYKNSKRKDRGNRVLIVRS